MTPATDSTAARLRCAALLASIGPAGRHTAGTGEGQPGELPESPPPSRVLVADDSAFVRYTVRKLLEQNGYRVVEAADGRAAAETYAAVRPDAVLLDITMPEADGLSALRAIRRIDPNARVVMVTGMGQQPIVLEAIKSGAADFIVKPFDPVRVLGALRRLLAI